MIFLDRNYWPVERIRGRYVQNVIRLVLHTRRIRRVRCGWCGKMIHAWEPFVKFGQGQDYWHESCLRDWEERWEEAERAAENDGKKE